MLKGPVEVSTAELFFQDTSTEVRATDCSSRDQLLRSFWFVKNPLTVGKLHQNNKVQEKTFELRRELCVNQTHLTSTIDSPISYNQRLVEVSSFCALPKPQYFLFFETRFWELYVRSNCRKTATS